MVTNRQSLVLGVWVVIAGAMAFAFYDALAFMVRQWTELEEYSHGFLIPVVSLFFIWQKKERLQEVGVKTAWSGLIIVALALALLMVGELSTLYVIVQYAFILLLVGLIITYAGWRFAAVIWAPLFLLIFMIPLPDFLYKGLSSQLQLISSELGVAVVRMAGISVHLQGNVIDLGSYQLEVAEACNGLRYLFPLTSFAFIAAYLFKDAFWKRALIFFSSIPITVFMNSFRIGVIGILVEHWGTSVAVGFVHDFQGWVVFMASAAILLAEMWLLVRIGGRGRRLSEVFYVDFPSGTNWAGLFRPHQRGPLLPFVMAAFLVVATSVASASLGGREEIIPDRMRFNEFPLVLGNWTGEEDRLEQIYVDALAFDDYILANYSNRDDKLINFYVAYYDSQRKGQSAHSPRSCIPGGGWQIRDISQVSIDGAGLDNSSLPVNRVVIARGDDIQLVYYWFQQRGRHLTNEYLVKWYLFWDALTKNRTDGALVRLTSQVRAGEDIAEIENQLKDYTRQVARPLRQFIPE